MSGFINDPQIENNLVDTIICNTLTEFNSCLTNTNENCIKIFHTNIRSIKKNYDELLTFLSLFEVFPDVIILSESWQISCSDYFNIPGYTTYYNNSMYNQNDGIVVIVSNKYSQSVSTIEFENKYKLMKISLLINNQIYGITLAYRPPEYNVNNFLANLKTYMNNISVLEN